MLHFLLSNVQLVKKWAMIKKSPQGHKQMDEVTWERCRANRGKEGPNSGKKNLLKLTCGGCKIYSFIVRKKMGKLYQWHRCASFCRPPGNHPHLVAI